MAACRQLADEACRLGVGVWARCGCCRGRRSAEAVDTSKGWGSSLGLDTGCAIASLRFNTHSSCQHLSFIVGAQPPPRCPMRSPVQLLFSTAFPATQAEEFRGVLKEALARAEEAQRAQLRRQAEQLAAAHAGRLVARLLINSETA